MSNISLLSVVFAFQVSLCGKNGVLSNVRISKRKLQEV